MNATITTAARRIQRDASTSPAGITGYYAADGVRVGSGSDTSRPAVWPVDAVIVFPAGACTQAEVQVWLDGAAAASAAGEVAGTGGYELAISNYRAAVAS